MISKATSHEKLQQNKAQQRYVLIVDKGKLLRKTRSEVFWYKSNKKIRGR